MIANKINGKQTKLTWNGVKYKASVVGDRGACHGCAFYEPSGMACPSVPYSGGRTTYCTKRVRSDGHTIVWVKCKKQPTQGE